MKHDLHMPDLPRGTRKKLAVILGVTPGAISQWKRVPAERVLDVERATGVSRHTLRPDIYPLFPGLEPKPDLNLTGDAA
jgi:Putative antitoxin of bacterial toxin-antitoxin system, YdaS/YdaT